MFKKISNDLKFTAINQLWKIIAGPFVLILIPIYLTEEVQGFWFTFVSLAALSGLIDLGFSSIMLQFSAHEFANLSFDKNGNIIGKEENINKLASLFNFMLKWLLKVVIIVTPIVLILGYIVLSNKGTNNVNWLFPWVIFGLSSILFFANNIILSFLEGCDSVAKAQKIRFFIGFTNTSIMLIGIIIKLNLFALSFSMLFSSLFGLVIILFKFQAIIFNFLKNSQKQYYDWKKEISKLFKRYAISNLSNYLTFSLFTPIVFYFYSPIEAGKVGLSIAVWTALFSISSIWIVSIQPKINIHVEKCDYAILNNIFKIRLALNICTFLMGFFCAIAIYFVMDYYNITLINRFVEPYSMLLLGFCWLIQSIVNSLWIYVRSHKVEPFMNLNILNAIFVSLTTVIVAKFFPLNYIFIGFFISSFWTILYTSLQFVKYSDRK